MMNSMHGHAIVLSMPFAAQAFGTWALLGPAGAKDVVPFLALRLLDWHWWWYTFSLRHWQRWELRRWGVLPGTVAASYASAGSLMRRCCIVWSATRPHDAWCCTNGAPTVLRCGDVFPPSLRSSVLARWLCVSWGVKGNNVYICMVSCI